MFVLISSNFRFCHKIVFFFYTILIVSCSSFYLIFGLLSFSRCVYSFCVNRGNPKTRMLLTSTWSCALALSLKSVALAYLQRLHLFVGLEGDRSDCVDRHNTDFLFVFHWFAEKIIIPIQRIVELERNRTYFQQQKMFRTTKSHIGILYKRERERQRWEKSERSSRTNAI